MKLNNRIEEMRSEIIQATKSLIRIKSVEEKAKPHMPFGEGVAKALEEALKLSKNIGFNVKNLDGYVGYAEYGEGDDYIAVLGHLDVVPAGNGWTYSPYGGEVHGGKLYGRGAKDDKGPLIAALYGLKAIKDLNLPISKRIRIIFGTNEETNTKDIPYYLDRERPPAAGFTPDAYYPAVYAEKGIITFDIVKNTKENQSTGIKILNIKGGQRANVVPDYCEVLLQTQDANSLIKIVKAYSLKTGYEIEAMKQNENILVKSYGISAPGSLVVPGQNAIMQLFTFLDTLDLGNKKMKEYISFLNQYIGMETKGESFGIYCKDETGELSFNVGTIDMNNNCIRITLNIRYPVTFELEHIMESFHHRIEGSCIGIENFKHKKPLYFPKHSSLVETLIKVYKEQTGIEAEPLSIGGGTYAKSMPNIIAFGPTFPGKPIVAHKPDEYIEIEDLILNAKIYAHAIYELAK